MRLFIYDKATITLDGMVQTFPHDLKDIPAGAAVRLSWTTDPKMDNFISIKLIQGEPDEDSLLVITPSTSEVGGTTVQLTVVASWEDAKPSDPDGIGDAVGEADPIDRMLVEAGLRIFGANIRATKKTSLNALADDINVLFQKKFKPLGGKQ